MEVDFSGNFTNPENCREGDLGVILDEGKIEEKESFKGVPYQQLNIGIEFNGKKLIHSGFYSGSIPASLIALAHLVVSSLIFCPRASGVPG